MYGFLRPAEKYLSNEAERVYTRIYCGQCAALHDLFGYVSRILTSYDAAFLGLLIAAQREEPEAVERRRCAFFPRKMDVCATRDIAARVSAALAVYLCAIRIKDKQQDGGSSLLFMLEHILNAAMKKANDILCSYGIPATLVSDSIQNQHAIEQRRANEVTEYARPTEQFLSELVRSTAIVAGKSENSEFLARIGACLGRIIYLVDSCVDLLDDLERREFNALLTVYAVDGGNFRLETGNQITDLIMASLMEIRGLIPRLGLARHEEIIGNILVVGLPFMIRRQLCRSMGRLKKYRPSLLKYAPHAAITSALCLFCAQNAEAKEISRGWECKSCPGINLLCNPCRYNLPDFSGDFCDKLGDLVCILPCTIICQAPKVIFFVYGPIYVGPKISKYLKQKNRERQQRKEEKRIRDNAAYLENSSKTIKEAEKAIRDKVVSLYGYNRDYPAIDFSFDRKFQRLISDASKFKQDILYSSSREIGEGLNKLTREANELDQKIRSVCETQEKLKQAIASVRQLQKNGNAYVENQLKLYEELTDASELTSLISDQRFDDYHAIAQKILGEISMFVKK